ncbi:unnamed protein product [Urochloa decumbens]|uniref:SWIM-type domain-containing protein n=1 Tax=Urochloa decumbens TaxID=240449 RepID=A0ABC8YD16_9POAL
MANHGLVLGHGQDAELALGQNHHDLSQDHDLIGQSHDHELVLGHDHARELALRQGHEGDSGALDVQGHHHDELELSESHELTLAEMCHLGVDQNLDDQLSLEQAHELAVHPHDLSQAPLSVAPVVQSRTMVVSPEFQLAVGQEFPDVRGSFEEEYRLLPEYCKQVERANPGSIARVYGNPDDNCFRRLFISFNASIFGFVNACRPLIGLDRVLLKNKYLGTLFLATGFDGDGALFPLAFGVVDEETDENWVWFLSELHELLEKNTENMPRLTIVSDRRKGIIDGVEFNFPTAFHGYCMRHISETFRKEFSNPQLVNLLWEASHALTVIEFETKLLEIEETSPEAVVWIRHLPPRLWATAYFEGTRYGHLTANITESLNSWILDASSLPIIQMIECIRRQLVMWFNERREASMQWATILVPTAERRVQQAIEHGRGYQVARANEVEFMVISAHEGTNIVDIRNRCCLCRGWQLDGVPCAHGVAALLYCRQNVHRYTESCFTVAMYRKTYSQTIHPIPDRTLWNETAGQVQAEEDKMEMIIMPPKSLRPPGRPRKKRIHAEDCTNQASRSLQPLQPDRIFQNYMCCSNMTQWHHTGSVEIASSCSITETS